MLTGQQPFQGDNLRAISKAILESPTPTLAGEASKLNGVVGRALSKSLESRYQAVTDFQRLPRGAAHGVHPRERLQWREPGQWGTDRGQLNGTSIRCYVRFRLPLAISVANESSFGSQNRRNRSSHASMSFKGFASTA